MDTWKISHIRSFLFIYSLHYYFDLRLIHDASAAGETRPFAIPMPRLSALPRPRESVFAGSHDLYRGDVNAVCPPNLRECVLAMEDCCEEVTIT